MKKVNDKGSLLLEALLVVIILSISLTLIIQSFMSSLRATVFSADYAKAAILADNKMFDLLSRQAFDTGTQEEGLFKSPFSEFKYHLEINSLDQGYGGDSLKEAALEITWPLGSKMKKISLGTYIFSTSATEE